MNKDSFEIFDKVDKFYEKWNREHSEGNSANSTKE